MAKLIYRPLSMLVSMAAGVLAGAIFRRIWKLAAGQDEAPRATDAGRGWPEILTAAALQGAIFAVVTASVERITAAGTRSLTGTWPGEDSSAAGEDSSTEKAQKAAS